MKERKKKLLDIVRGMTLQEKALQLTQYTVYSLFKDGEEQVVTGNTVLGGMTADMLWKTGSVLNGLNGETVQRVRQMRRAKGIDDPVIVMLDVIHGYKTIFPVPLAVSCSFDTVLAERCAKMSAEEAKYDGTDVTFSPMADLCRDARWGRVMESFGEDPYLVGEMAKAFIRGYHKGGLGVCVKHFAAYGACEGGRDYDTVELSERTLKEYYLRAYKECLQENPEMFMCAFNALGGLPMIANRTLLYDTLRSEWGFDGVLISDYGAVAELIRHGYVATEKECAIVAAKNGLDIEMCSPSYALHLPDLVRDGVLSESEIDESVYRVVALKDKLGLYENPDRFTDSVKREEVTLCDRHRELARVAAEESFVLLKNNGILPLSDSREIALIGPFADTREIVGGWNCKCELSDTVTVREGVQNLLGRAVLCEKACGVGLFDTDESAFARAVEAAKNVDVIIACVGESMLYSGEAHSRVDIAVPKIQIGLLQRLRVIGKPIAVVLFGGRPQVLTELEPLADAILCVWQPGTEGGNAIANTLFGRSCPSGKLTVSFPRSVGQCPIYYNRLSTGRPRRDDIPNILQKRLVFETGYDDERNTPLYPFGYGLSYTKFAYTNLRLSAESFCGGQKIVAAVDVKNVGVRDGKETVQWYIRDLFASVVRPVKELKGYEKIFIAAGEQKTVYFEINEEALAFYTVDGEYKAESGDFELYAGGNSEDCLVAEFSYVAQ